MPSFFGAIDWFLAYGNAEQGFFRDHSALYDAITLPGTVATFFRQGAGGFVLALKKPYIIDPRTSIFQSAFDRGRLGTRHMKLAEMHGPTLTEIIKGRALLESDLQHGLLDEMARSVVAFQRTYVQTSADKLDEYRRRLGEDAQEPLHAYLTLPPYFRFDRAHGPWHEASVSMATTAIRCEHLGPVCPVVCLSERCLASGDFDAIVRTYDHEGFGGYFVWVSKWDQYRTSPANLRAFAEMVRSFRATGRPVINLFGGYFSAMLVHLGLAGLSHGVGYGEARDAFYYRGGPPSQRYYVPMLHRFYPRSDAERLLDLLGGLAERCDCPACVRVSEEQDTPATQAGRLDRQGLLSHFLYVRRKELEHVARTPLDTLISELQSTYDSIAHSLPQTRAPLVVPRIQHLSRWVEALTGL